MIAKKIYPDFTELIFNYLTLINILLIISYNHLVVL